MSHFGRRMSLFLQTLVLRSILSSEQEHRQEDIGVEMTRCVQAPMVEKMKDTDSKDELVAALRSSLDLSAEIIRISRRVEEIFL